VASGASIKPGEPGEALYRDARGAQITGRPASRFLPFSSCAPTGAINPYRATLRLLF
jgi:hypothetical protein